jgi:hypothetical protein
MKKAYRYVVSLIATDAVVAAIAIVIDFFGRGLCSEDKSVLSQRKSLYL